MRRHGILGLALALAALTVAVGGRALAWTNDGPFGRSAPFAVSVPTWTHFDTHGPFGLDGYYPERALRFALGGNATVHCQVTDKRRLRLCEVVSESSPNFGFGAAALAVSERLSLDADAPVVDGQVDVPVSFLFSGPDIHAVVTAAPTRDQVAAAYPQSATADGRATIRCGMGNGGVLSGCFVKAETPAKQGFGDAALSLADSFRVGVSESDPRRILMGRFDISVAFHNPSAPPGSPREVRDPSWIRDFDPAHLAAVYPVKAKEAGVLSGKAVLRCIVSQAGALANCEIVEEAPAGLGFGDALTKVAGEMAISPWSADGEPLAGATIQIPLVLKAPADTPGS